MSSIAEDQLGGSSPRSSPPESAQTFQSLFGGGPISQNVDLEPYPESQDGEGVEGNEQDDLEIIMGNIPMMQDDQSDATYHSSDENESEPERKHNKGDGDGRVKKRKRPAVAGSTSGRMRERPDSPPSSPVYRPNRFRGFESTWRKLTAEERQNAQALETIRARDLAAHLYNAYSLRVRAGERGMKSAKGNEHLNGSGAFAFVPPRRWTAWPMSSDEVPRLDERLRREEDDAWSLRMPPDPRPSADLEETVIAMMMKTAKERFGIRDWESKRAISVPRKRGESQFEPYDGSTANEEDWDSDSELTYGADLLPVVQADDDKSKQQLRPIARNVLTQFDKLLMGLHHSQKGGVADDSSASERQSDTESVVSSTSPVKKDARDEKERSQSRGRKRTRILSRSAKSTGSRSRSVRQSTREGSTHGGSQHTSRARSIGRGGERSASRLREGLRDWSEVMGTAAMVGCPSAVVMRAAKRCSALFGEDMVFQSFHEGVVEKVKEEDGTDAVQYIENEPEPVVSPSPPPQSRSRRSRSRASSIKREFTSRPASPALENGTEVPLPKGKGQHRKQDLVCPVKTCPRHTNGFTRTWNLNLHLKRMHPGYRGRSTSARAPVKIYNSDQDTADEE